MNLTIGPLLLGKDFLENESSLEKDWDGTSPDEEDLKVFLDEP
jgi:hypothetical protein